MRKDQHIYQQRMPDTSLLHIPHCTYNLKRWLLLSRHEYMYSQDMLYRHPIPPCFCIFQQHMQCKSRVYNESVLLRSRSREDRSRCRLSTGSREHSGRVVTELFVHKVSMIV